MSYYYDEDPWFESCPHTDVLDWIDEAGWTHEHSSVWYEVWMQECGVCGEVQECRYDEVRIEVTALEDVMTEWAA